MGTIWHEAVIVTDSDYRDAIKIAHKAAVEIFGEQLVGPILNSTTNGYQTFMVASCGSKLGWDTYEKHVANIKEFLKRIRAIEPYMPDYVVLRYGADWEHVPTPIRHNSLDNAAEDDGWF